jgi:sugar fermentation stimulation protein A
MGKQEITAFLPNPGRLMELLLPGCPLYLVRDNLSKNRKNPYTVVAVKREGMPIMLHTHKTNAVAAYLIDQGQVPGLEKARCIGKEITIGHSRFDLLLHNEGEEILMEVKSCTLVGKKVAMFPDAVTERGSRHLRELAKLAANGRKTAVLFVIHWPKAKIFMPDYHTDLVFARTMLDCRDRIRFFPLAVHWKEDLSLDKGVRLLPIPWEVIEREAEDRGSYLLILKLAERKTIPVMKLGHVPFRPGYYVYVGSAMSNLTARMERHRRPRKNQLWPIDYLRSIADFHSVIPVRCSVSLECSMAERLKPLSDWTIPAFGSSDCSCFSHLFGLNTDPFQSKDFMALVQYFRMDRLYGKAK